MTFGNCASRENGEYLFFQTIKPYINIIFDVGTNSHSDYIEFEGEVHYFEPLVHKIKELETRVIKNKKPFFNYFGLGNETKFMYFYPRYESFYNRINSCQVDDSANKMELRIKKSKEYIMENNISHIDFLKIDTEGFEFEVIKGFEEFIKNINIIQFEYGGTFLDNNIKLIEVVRYLENYGFKKFAYLNNRGVEIIHDFTDHYNYCNIVCINENSAYQPY